MGKTGRLLDASIIALAIAVRVAAVLVLRSHEVPRSTYEHGEIAANLLAGRGFSIRFLGADGPTSQQAPIYPLVVAAAYAIGGVGTPRALLILEMGQIASWAASSSGASCGWHARSRRIARHGGRGRIDRGPPSDARLCRDPRPGRRPRRDPAGLDVGVGLSDRERPARHATPRSTGVLLGAAGADRPDPLAGDGRGRLGRRLGRRRPRPVDRGCRARGRSSPAWLGIAPWLVRN